MYKKIKKGKNILIFILFFFNTQLIVAQRYEGKKDSTAYNFCNDEIVNGVLYNFPDKRIVGTPFLTEQEWNKAIIYKGGRTYTNQLCNYDLVSDRIILKTSPIYNYERYISVNKFQIDSVFFDNKLFVYSGIVDTVKPVKTYYEQIYSGQLSLYRVYEKRFIDMYSSTSPFGKFSELRTKLYVLNKQFIPLNSKKEFLSLFNSVQRKEVIYYLKAKKINFNKSSNYELENLMIFCNTLN
jgi:hypothetical protein